VRFLPRVLTQNWVGDHKLVVGKESLQEGGGEKPGHVKLALGELFLYCGNVLGPTTQTGGGGGGGLGGGGGPQSGFKARRGHRSGP